MRRSPTAAALLVGIASWLGTAATPAHAADADRGDALARGDFLYRAHCASCHGPEGRGDGPVAEELRTTPADLTRLSEKGPFVVERVRLVIDGRQEMAAHGSREMPIWGFTFGERDRTQDQEQAVKETIDDLLVYLRSIQGGGE